MSTFKPNGLTVTEQKPGQSFEDFINETPYLPQRAAPIPEEQMVSLRLQMARFKKTVEDLNAGLLNINQYHNERSLAVLAHELRECVELLTPDEALSRALKEESRIRSERWFKLAEHLEQRLSYKHRSF